MRCFTIVMVHSAHRWNGGSYLGPWDDPRFLLAFALSSWVLLWACLVGVGVLVHNLFHLVSASARTATVRRTFGGLLSSRGALP